MEIGTYTYAHLFYYNIKIDRPIWIHTKYTVEMIERDGSYVINIRKPLPFG